jgi:hypothetical protein
VVAKNIRTNINPKNKKNVIIQIARTNPITGITLITVITLITLITQITTVNASG